MKKLLIILFLCSMVYGANEIRSFNAGATTCFAVIREIDGDVWHIADQQFEVWGTDANDADDYDIALTDKTGGMFVGDFNTAIAAGYYYVISHQQEGGSPADTDPATWQEYGYWDTSTWTTSNFADVPTKEEIRAEIDANSTQLALIVEDTNELQEDWTDGGRLDLLIDGIKAYTDLIVIVDTNVATIGDANTFTLTAGMDVNDIYNGYLMMVQDANDSHYELAIIEDYTSARVVTVEHTLNFTPAEGDKVYIVGTSYLGSIWWLIKHYSYINHFYDYTERD